MCTFSFFFLHFIFRFLRSENPHFHVLVGMITIPAASLAGAQIVQAGGTSTNTTNSNQGTVTVTLPVSGNMVNAGGMVMVRPCAEVPNILLLFMLCRVTQGVRIFIIFIVR